MMRVLEAPLSRRPKTIGEEGFPHKTTVPPISSIKDFTIWAVSTIPSPVAEMLFCLRKARQRSRGAGKASSMAAWTFWCLSFVICQGVLSLLTLESSEVPQEPQSLFLALFRVKLDSIDIPPLHGAGKLDPIGSHRRDIRGVFRNSIIGVDKVEVRAALDARKEGGLLCNLHAVPSHVGDGQGLADLRIADRLGEPRHPSRQDPHPLVEAEFIALLKEELQTQADP